MLYFMDHYHLKATISIEHNISIDEDAEHIQRIRHSLEAPIRYYCEPWDILYKTETFWHYPDECAESCGQKFLGTTFVLTRSLKKPQSYYYVANYLRAVVDLLMLSFPDSWGNAVFELF